LPVLHETASRNPLQAEPEAYRITVQLSPPQDLEASAAESLITRVLGRWVSLGRRLALLVLLILTVPLPALASGERPQGSPWTAVRVLYEEGAQVQLEASSTSRIDLIGSWRKSTLTVLLEPHTSDAHNLNALEGIRWWGRAIRVFTALYGNEHLDRLSIVTLIRGVNGTSGDITVSFAGDLGSRICGVTYLNGDGDEIVSARVQISLRCVGSDMELVRVVSSHEFGHALGLDHTDNSQDLMYPYVVRGSRPSTLNLYALAVAYSWLRGGTGDVPSSVELPASIPYRYLLDVNGLPIRMRVTILRQIDDGPPVTLRTILVEAGGSVELTAEGLIYPTDAAGIRFRFEGWWDESGRRISGDARTTLRPKDHVTVVQRYVTQFFVRVERPVDPVSGWFDRGTRISVRIDEVIDFNNGTRLRFVRWDGPGNVVDGSVEIVVDSPISAQAVYVRQHLLRIAALDGELSLWIDEGSRVSYREVVGRTVVDFGNGTRLSARGFDVGGQPVESVEVSGPMELRLVWAREHLVRVVREPIGKVTELWAEEGSELELRAEELVDLGNRTRLAFRSWAGDVAPSSPVTVVRVDRPLTALARYAVQYLVEVRSEVTAYSGELWADAGSVVTLSVPEHHEASEGSRYVFVGWSGDVASDERTLRVQVERPLVASANWLLQHRVLLEMGPLGSRELWVRDGELLIVPREAIVESDGRLALVSLGTEVMRVVVRGPVKVEAGSVLLLERARLSVDGPADSSVVVEANGLRIEVAQGSQVLLPEVWKVRGVSWRGSLQTEGDVQVTPLGGGDYLVPLRVRTVRVLVRDALGLPAPGVDVRLVNDAGVVESYSVTGWDGVAELTVVGDREKAILVPGGSAVLEPWENGAVLTTSDGLYAIVALSLAVWAVPYLVLTPRLPPRSRRGSRTDRA